MRHMAKDVVNPDHWPTLSEETQRVIRKHEYAHHLFMSMRERAKVATDWYELAESDREIARWVPQGGGGDCYIIYPGEINARECGGMFDALLLYLQLQRTEECDAAWNELRDMRELFFLFDKEEL